MRLNKAELQDILQDNAELVAEILEENMTYSRNEGTTAPAPALAKTGITPPCGVTFSPYDVATGQLTWTKSNSAGALLYRVVQDGVTIQDTDASSAEVSGMVEGVETVFQVVAHDGVGEESQPVQRSYTPPLSVDPDAPVITNIAAAIVEGNLEITWNTVDSAGDPLPTFGTALYGVTADLGQSAGESSREYSSHRKRISGFLSGATYHYRIEVRTADSAIVSADGVPIAIPASGTWLSNTLLDMPTLPSGRTWTQVYASDDGDINDSHGRITNGHTIGGFPCYAHNVKQGDEVIAVDQDGPYINVDLTPRDFFMLRVRFRFTDYSGHPSKHVSLSGGRGYQGDMIRNSDLAFNPPISAAQAFGSTEFAVANLMGPASGTTQNTTRIFVTHAANTPNFNEASGADNSQFSNEYFGDNLPVSAVPSLNEWHTADVIGRRDGGWIEYLDGVKVSESSDVTSDTRIFNNWNAQKCIWWWSRHMHGGTPSSLLALRDYIQYWGGFSLHVA